MSYLTRAIAGATALLVLASAVGCGSLDQTTEPPSSTVATPTQLSGADLLREHREYANRVGRPVAWSVKHIKKPSGEHDRRWDDFGCGVAVQLEDRLFWLSETIPNRFDPLGRGAATFDNGIPTGQVTNTSSLGCPENPVPPPDYRSEYWYTPVDVRTGLAAVAAGGAFLFKLKDCMVVWIGDPRNPYGGKRYIAKSDPASPGDPGGDPGRYGVVLDGPFSLAAEQPESSCMVL